jgi:hypothetical protein
LHLFDRSRQFSGLVNVALQSLSVVRLELDLCPISIAHFGHSRVSATPPFGPCVETGAPIWVHCHSPAGAAHAMATEPPPPKRAHHGLQAGPLGYEVSS